MRVWNTNAERPSVARKSNVAGLRESRRQDIDITAGDVDLAATDTLPNPEPARPKRKQNDSVGPDTPGV